MKVLFTLLLFFLLPQLSIIYNPGTAIAFNLAFSLKISVLSGGFKYIGAGKIAIFSLVRFTSIEAVNAWCRTVSIQFVLWTLIVRYVWSCGMQNTNNTV